MSFDAKEKQNMPKDTLGLTRPQASAKSNYQLPDLDTCMQRLAVVSEQSSASAIMRWLGLPATTYSNWKRRKSVNYDRVVDGLLRHGVSLDWFFAPGADLTYPQVSGLVNENGADYEVSNSIEVTLKALNVVEPIMREHGVAMTEHNRKLMAETLLKGRGTGILLEAALHQVAKALATTPTS